MRHLVGDRGGPLDALTTGDLAGEQQWVAQRHAPGVLHGTGIELRHERLVVVAERVADAEEPVELVEALLGHREQLVGVGVEGRGDRPAGTERQRDTGVLVVEHVVGPGHQGHEVRRQRGSAVELPRAGLHLLSGRVADDRPVPGRRTWNVNGALRSGWSKHAKIDGAASMNDIP